MPYTGPEIKLVLFLVGGWEMTGEEEEPWKTPESGSGWLGYPTYPPFLSMKPNMLKFLPHSGWWCHCENLSEQNIAFVQTTNRTLRPDFAPRNCNLSVWFYRFLKYDANFTLLNSGHITSPGHEADVPWPGVCLTAADRERQSRRPQARAGVPQREAPRCTLGPAPTLLMEGRCHSTWLEHLSC